MAADAKIEVDFIGYAERTASLVSPIFSLVFRSINPLAIFSLVFRNTHLVD
jgi:hypothetical protein